LLPSFVYSLVIPVTIGWAIYKCT